MANEAAEPTPAQTDPRDAGLPALRLVRPLAIFALLAFLLGRAFGPAAMGIGVGLEDLLSTVDLGGSILSQLFSIAVTVLTIALILSRARTDGSSVIRVGGPLLGAAVVYLSMRASTQRLAEDVSLTLGIVASLGAVLAAWDARTSLFARPVAGVVGLTGLSALVRLFGLWGLEHFAGLGPVLATAAFVLEALALGLAVTWIASRGRKLTSPSVIVALAIAMLATQRALAGSGAQADAASVLIQRAASRLLTLPPPAVPDAARFFVALVGPLIAGAALLVRGQLPALVGSLALALLVQSSPDIPLAGLSLVTASLALSLAARDHRGFWATLPPRRLRPFERRPPRRADSPTKPVEITGKEAD